MRSGAVLLLGAACWAVSGCGGGKAPEEERDNSEREAAWYRENPEFFVFATPADIPADLVWETGADLPEIGSPEAKKGGTLRGAIQDFPRTLRHIGPDSNGSFRTYLTDTMMAFAHRHPNVDGYFPGLAEAWAAAPDKRTVYVRLHPEARWSDGEPVTSDDVFFSFYFRQSPDNSAPWYQNFYREEFEKIVRYDERTLSITVARSKPDYLSYALELTPVPRHFYKGFQEDYPQYYQWKFQPTTGAYVILDEDIKKGRSIALRRNKDWWARDLKFWRYRYNPDTLSLPVIRDPNKTVEAFKSGEIDMLALNLAEYWYDKIPDDDPIVAGGYVHKVTFYNDIPRSGPRLWMNTANELLANQEIRLGLQHASGFDKVIKEFFRGDWARENTLSDGYGDVTHPGLRYRPFSEDEARRHFAAAGFDRPGPDGVLTNAEGRRLSFTVTSGYRTLSDALEILKQEALKAGVEFNIDLLDSTAGWKKVQEKKHEIALTGFATFATEQYPRYWETFHGENAYNPDGSVKTQTNNLTSTRLPDLDALIDQYRAAETHEAKRELAHRIEEILHADAAVVPGVYLPFYRIGYWRWIRWPEDFNVKKSELPSDYYLHWIDEGLRAETEKARKEGRALEKVIRTYDQYRATR